MNNIDVIKNITNKSLIKIVDCHVHPLDVLNQIDISTYNTIGEKLYSLKHEANVDWRNNFYKIHFPSQLKHTLPEILIMRFGFNFLKNMVKRGIDSLYEVVGSKRIDFEMKSSYISKSVFLPVEPFCKLEDIIAFYPPDEKYTTLVSPDFTLSVNNMKSKLLEQIEQNRSCGIKIHPNIQGVNLIINSNNNFEKLETIFSIAEKNRLYLHFHGGRSNFLPNRYQNLKHQTIAKKQQNYSRLENFIKSPILNVLFSKYDCNIIIAHLASYGEINLPVKKMKLLLNKFPNIKFDTSGTSSYSISKAIKSLGSEYIIYGSDSFYSNSLLELEIAIEGVINSCSKQNLEYEISKIFSENYTHFLNKST